MKIRSLTCSLQAALHVPVVLPFHGAAVEHAPFEVGDVAEQDDLGEGLLVERALAESGLGAFEDFVFVVAEHDVEIAAALLHGGELHGFGDALLAAPGEAHRHVLQREVGEVVRAGVLHLEVEAGVAGQRRRTAG